MLTTIAMNPRSNLHTKLLDSSSPSSSLSYDPFTVGASPSAAPFFSFRCLIVDQFLYILTHIAGRAPRGTPHLAMRSAGGNAAEDGVEVDNGEDIGVV